MIKQRIQTADLHNLWEQMMDGEILNKIESIMTVQTDKMIVNRTPKLWLQYIHMVYIFKRLIKAE